MSYYQNQQGGKQGDKGKGKNYVEPWGGKSGVPSGEGGGGAARVWRDNMRQLQQYYNPDISVSLWLNHLSLYCTQTWPEVGLKGDWESNRVFLEKVKEKVAPGLVFGPLHVGWIAQKLKSMWAGWIAQNQVGLDSPIIK